jgi:hypothetical protein
MFSASVDVLGIIQEDSLHSEEKGEARSICLCFTLDENFLGITNELSTALQKKNQDIVNAMTLVKVTRQRLQMIRDDE